MKPRGGFVWRFVQRLVFALLLAGLALAGRGLWLYQRDPTGWEKQRQQQTLTLTAGLGDLRKARAGVETRMASARVEIAAQKERAEQAAKVSRQLDELSTGFNRLTTSSEQLRENRERMANMQSMLATALQSAAGLEQGLVRIQWEKDGLEIALARKQAELTAVLADESAVRHYAREAWSGYGRWALIVATVVAFGPMLRPRRAG